MDETTKANLYPCAHCEGTGTCSNGKDGTSCAACVKRNQISIFFRFKPYTGLACGSCIGIGQAEPMTERLNKRMRPLIGLYIIAMLFIFIAVAFIFQSEHFPAVLAFSGTLIGSITGYYFSSNRTNE